MGLLRGSSSTTSCIGAPVIVPQLFNDQFAYFSDCHVADRRNGAFWRPMPRVLPVHGVLAICGDTGLPTERRFDEFFRQIAPDFDKILVVFGNHEFDCSSVYDARKVQHYRPILLDVLSRYPNVVVLDNDVVPLSDDTWIAGTTLWSDADVKKRTPAPAGGAASTSFSKHAEDVEWLDSTIKLVDLVSDRKHRVVVLSHFPPTEHLIEEKYRSLAAHRSGRFWTNLEDKFMFPGSSVVGWVAGHSHTKNMRCQINGVDLRLHSKHQ